MSEGRQYYQNMIRHFSILSREEVKELYHKMDQGTEAQRKHARETMINHNLRLVVKVLNRYRLDDDTYEDALQEGNQGLMRAVDKFDPSMGYAFSTYADRWIRYRIEHYVRELYHVANVPVDVQKANSKVVKAKRELARFQDEGSISAKMISDYLDVPLEEVERSLSLVQSTVMMDAPMGEDGGSVGDFYTYGSADDERTAMEVAVLMDQARDCVMRLPAQQRDMVCRAYGIGCSKETYQSIGDGYSLSRERVRQIVEAAKMKLRNWLGDDIEKVMPCAA